MAMSSAKGKVAESFTWDPVEDARSADLGDRRLDARLEKVLSRMMAAPSRSLPEMFENDAELAAAYRFTESRRFGWRDVLAPHAARTASRAGRCGRVLVVDDTTTVSFALRDGHRREHLSTLATRTQGFLLHVSLVLDGGGTGCPLGVLRAQPFVHGSGLETSASRRFWRKEGGLYDNESSRWLESMRACDAALGPGVSAIHVADRESDLFEVVAQAASHGMRYVLRANQDRGVVSDDPSVTCISAALEAADWLPLRRRIHLGSRSANRPSERRRTHPPRVDRDADLSFRATRVELKRPGSVPASSGLPATCPVNLVEVLERHPPGGEPPVHWRLLTSEPVATAEQVLQVVDDYRRRWTIEEFFKGLKTGGALEERQAESAAALLKLVALSAPIAAHLLLLRHLHRHAPDLPATLAFSPPQLLLLRHDDAARLRGENPTVGEAVEALARMGGHRKNNGPPGWLILSRAFMRLLDQEAGWYHAIEFMQRR